MRIGDTYLNCVIKKYFRICWLGRWTNHLASPDAQPLHIQRAPNRFPQNVLRVSGPFFFKKHMNPSWRTRMLGIYQAVLCDIWEFKQCARACARLSFRYGECAKVCAGLSSDKFRVGRTFGAAALQLLRSDTSFQSIGRPFAHACAGLSSDRFRCSHNVPGMCRAILTDLDIQTIGLGAKVLCRATKTWVTSFSWPHHGQAVLIGTIPTPHFLRSIEMNKTRGKESITTSILLFGILYLVQLMTDQRKRVAEHCRPWPFGAWVHKLVRMHGTIHTQVQSS